MVGTGYSKAKKKLASLLSSLKPEKWSLFEFIFKTQTLNSEKMCPFYWLSRWLLYLLHIGFSNIFWFCYTSVLLKYTESYFRAKISIIYALHKPKGLVHCAHLVTVQLHGWPHGSLPRLGHCTSAPHLLLVFHWLAVEGICSHIMAFGQKLHSPSG